MEKRSTSRVPFTADARVLNNGRMVSGTVDNLSLKGMYFLTDREIAIDSPVEIQVSLNHCGATTELELQGLVVRTDEGGWGILFTSMGLEVFGHLRNVIIYNCGQDETVMDEFRKVLAQGLGC